MDAWQTGAGAAPAEGTGMKGWATGISAVVLAGCLLGAQAGAQGVAPPAGQTYRTAIVLKQIVTQKIRTPEYRVSIPVNTVHAARDWYQVTVQFETHAEWTDELNLACYVLLRGKTPTGPRQTLLRGEITLINIAKGKHKYEWYVHPGSLARYGDPEAVAVLIRRQGQLVAMMSNPPDRKRWWEELTPLDGMVLRRADTPFGLLSYDDFDQTKPAAEGR